jgi:hypothetical protein
MENEPFFFPGCPITDVLVTLLHYRHTVSLQYLIVVALVVFLL